MKKKLKNQNGFTLIELLVVIAMIGALAAVLVTAINPVAQAKKSRNADRKSDLAQIQSALEYYRSDAGAYPSSLPACGSAFTNANGTTTYLKKVPCDPTTGTSYIYVVDTTSYSNYCVRGCFENVSDADRDAANSNYGSVDNPSSSATGCPSGIDQNTNKCTASGQTNSYTLSAP